MPLQIEMRIICNNGSHCRFSSHPEALLYSRDSLTKCSWALQYIYCMWKGWTEVKKLLICGWCLFIKRSTKLYLCYVAPVSSLLNCILIMLPLQYPPYNAPLFQNWNVSSLRCPTIVTCTLSWMLYRSLLTCILPMMNLYLPTHLNPPYDDHIVPYSPVSSLWWPYRSLLTWILPMITLVSYSPVSSLW